MKKLILPLLLMLSGAAAGCQSNGSGGQANDLQLDRNAPHYRAYQQGNRAEGNDVTNQNPNFLDLHGTQGGNESGGAGNTGEDVAKAKQVIDATKEFRTDAVWISGDGMWVSVFKKGRLTSRSKIDAQARLHYKLVRALPRYNIRVTVQEDQR